MRANSPIKQNLRAGTANLGARPPLGWLVLLILLTSVAARAATIKVLVGGGAPSFSPNSVTIQPGDTVQWVWNNDRGYTPSVTSGSDGQADGLFDSGFHTRPFTFSFTFPNAGTFPYFSKVYYSQGMTGTVTVSASSPPASQPLNISTRTRVQTGENVMIGGFIITGNAPKKVIIRAIGPSITQVSAGDLLADPVLELRGSSGSLITSNDNWKDTQQADIQATGIPPQNDLESAIVATLTPGGYTAIVKGKGGATGVGLVEVYDLDQPADSKLANISTRGFVQTGSNVMIGGFILGNGSSPANVIIRALGPSLTQANVAGAMADPTLELRDANGALVRSNDNWKDSQQAEIQASGIPPQNDLESAIVATLSPAAYTAIVSGKGGTTGVGLVEVYRLP